MLVRDADFAADYASIHLVRTAVFIDEQRVPAELEFDERDTDPACFHVVAFAADLPVATGRLDLGYDGKVGRVAVLAAYRKSGVGTRLMERLHTLARAHGLTRVWCHAQTSAVPFYERLGYRPSGEFFMEAGIEHVQMELTL